MSIIGGVVVGLIGGAYLFYKNRSKIFYNLLHLYTNVIETYNNNKTLGEIYLCNKKLCDKTKILKNIDNDKHINDNTISVLYSKDGVIHYSFTQHNNLKDIYDNMSNNEELYKDLKKSYNLYDNSILAISVDISLNGDVLKNEIDITNLINYFLIHNTKIFLNQKYKNIILNLLKEHNILDINNITDKHDDIELSYNLIGTSTHIFNSNAIDIHIDNNGICNIEDKQKLKQS